MPTSTFFRLPEEKRSRLLEACWAEFTRVPYTELSINRIISAAHIPRGSFYQYFADRDELIHYLLEEMRRYFISVLRDILVEARGDLFAIPLGAFDRFLRQTENADPMLVRFIRVLKLNRGISSDTFWITRPGLLPDPLWEATDPSVLRQGDRLFADHIFFLTMAILAYAVAETVQNPSQRGPQREIIQARVEMLRNGCAATGDKEEHP